MGLWIMVTQIWDIFNLAGLQNQVHVLCRLDQKLILSIAKITIYKIWEDFQYKL